MRGHPGVTSENLGKLCFGTSVLLSVDLGIAFDGLRDPSVKYIGASPNLFRHVTFRLCSFTTSLL